MQSEAVSLFAEVIFYDANHTIHIADTHLPQTSLSEADASLPNVMDGAAGSLLEQDLVQSRCTRRLLRPP